MAPRLLTWGSVALSALPLASAHMYMKTPTPFDQTSLQQDRSPLQTGQYPCKFQDYTFSKRNELAVGQQYTLSFYPGNAEEIAAIGSTTGAAVHDGGSCQLSITLDKEPTAKSVFKVFHSIEGGCPGVNNQASTFQYSLPDSIPNGEYTLAWSWFPVSSAIPEMYMNCAPITVSGGASDESKFNELPDMFVGNIGFSSFSEAEGLVGSLLSTVTQTSLLSSGQVPQCLAKGEAVLEFPDPGDSLVVDQANLKGGLAKPSGQCAAGKSSTSGSSSGSSGSQSSASTSSTATTSTSVASVGGIYAENPSPAPTTLVTMTSPAAAPVAETSAAPVAETSAAAVATTEATTAAAAAPAASSPVAAAGATQNSACTDSNDGQVVCNGTSQFGLCNRGYVAWQDVSAGMACKDGKVVAAN